MDFKAASAFKIPFGKYLGKTLDQVASSDEGLKYLDWLAGQSWVRPKMRGALDAYLGDPSIKKELESL